MEVYAKLVEYSPHKISILAENLRSQVLKDIKTQIRGEEVGSKVELTKKKTR